MSVFIQHGFGQRVTATTTPQRLVFTESGQNRRARSVSVKNTGSQPVLLLVNVSSNNTEMINQFSNLSPVILEAGDAFVFVPEPLQGPALKNIGYATSSDETELVIAAF